MSGSMSDYLEDLLSDHVLGGGDYTRPATVYIGLWTAALDDTSDGDTAGEVSGVDYDRVAVTNNNTNFPAASGGVKTHATDFIFPAAGGSWGTVTHIAVLDAATSGNILFHADLTTPKTIDTGDIAKFPAGGLVFNAN